MRPCSLYSLLWDRVLYSFQRFHIHTHGFQHTLVFFKANRWHTQCYISQTTWITHFSVVVSDIKGTFFIGKNISRPADRYGWVSPPVLDMMWMTSGKSACPVAFCCCIILKTICTTHVSTLLPQRSYSHHWHLNVVCGKHGAYCQ